MKITPIKKILSIISLVAFLIVALSISACSADGSTAPEETVPDEPKYTVQLFIDCQENLMFSKYDVDVRVDGEKVGNVEHGNEAAFELSLNKGQHELVLNEKGASEPDGRISFVVGSEGDRFSYRISCTKNRIGIEPISEEIELAEEEPVTKPTEEEKAVEAEAAKRAEEEAAEAEAGDTERTELDGCVGDTADHAREVAKATGRTPHFRYQSIAYGYSADRDVESGKYEGAMRRAKVTEVSYDFFGGVTFTLDRPLAVSAEDDEELRALLQLENPHDDTLYSLYKKQRWDTNIEFDGQVMKVDVEGSENNPYYHIVIRPVDYDSGQVSGPAFRFDYVRHDDPSFEGVRLNEIVKGSELHVIAEIEDYNGVRKLIELTPLQISSL